MCLSQTLCPGYSQVKSTTTSCSPITVHVTLRFCPTATVSEEAWIAGDGGAAGSAGYRHSEIISDFSDLYGHVLMYRFQFAAVC